MMLPAPSSRLLSPDFVWWPAKGYGFLPPAEKFDYGVGYFESCARQEGTVVGRKLIQARKRMLTDANIEDRSSEVVDVGIGAGAFVEATGCFGYDINPAARRWLEGRGAWKDVTLEDADTICLWDSMEHMMSPEIVIAHARKNVLVSLPIFEGPEHALASKHFKPNEHLWYFTERGLIFFMKINGFSMIERNRDEERFGREGIGSYWFRRLDDRKRHP